MDTLMRITDHLTTSPGIQLKIDKRWCASVTFVKRSIAHVRIFDAAGPQLDRTWSISVGSDVTPRTGLGPRDLLDHSPAPAWEGNSRDVAPVEDMEVTTTVTASAENTASHPGFTLTNRSIPQTQTRSPSSLAPIRCRSSSATARYG